MKSKNQIYAGAFERLGVGGVSMAMGSQAMGIRLLYPHVALGLFDGREVLFSLDKTFMEAPDLSYVRYAWRVPVTASGIKRFGWQPRYSTNSPIIYPYKTGEAIRVVLEWSFDGKTVIGRYTSEGQTVMGLLVNGCFAPAVILEAQTDKCRIKQNGVQLSLSFRGKTKRPYCADSYKELERSWFNGLPVNGKTLAIVPVELAPDFPLYFAMGVASTHRTDTACYPICRPENIDRQLDNAGVAYHRSRMRSKGFCKGAAEAVASLAGYSRHYDPKRQRIMTAVNRTWGGMNQAGGAFGWDNFFTSYIAAWENPGLGAASLEHILSIYKKGWMRSDVPPQRNLIIPILYCRTVSVLGDQALARRTWPIMMNFIRSWFSDRGDGMPWRDGNGDGLIESGSCMDIRKETLGHMISNAMDETGYDDLPVYSAGFVDGRRGQLANDVEFDRKSQTLTITLICQNSLYCAACRIMADMAAALGKTDDERWLRREAQRIRNRILKRLYCPESGIFQDRRWDGSFSRVKAMTVFYPLLAGIADDQVKANLKRMLLDPRQFWGDNLIPTVSRDDPAYCDGLDYNGNYWRGNCWPPTTYIVYLAIKEAGWDDIAAEYARRVCGQFLEDWNRHGHAYENYPAEGKVDHTYFYPGNWGGREIRYVWSAIMPFCALEEIFGPEMVGSGVRFGNPWGLQPSAWKGFYYAGKRIEAEIGKQRTWVKVNGGWEFLSRPGVVVRDFVQKENCFCFTIKTTRSACIEFMAPRITSRSVVAINRVPVSNVGSGRKIAFKISSGSHIVEIK
ncbi:MAG: hypothetical protein KKD33_01200 [Verrucomicrobia bacterium]|nr:hypothetical protein [Verrucomicrobiota bacterium]